MTRRRTPPAAVAVPRVFSIDWPPGFVSAIQIDPRTKKYETDYARQQRNRAAGGWDAHPIFLPKTPTSRPVKTMEKP